MKNENVLTDDEMKMVEQILSKLSPGYLPFNIFAAVSRLVVTATAEVIPFRKGNNGLEVLLIERPKSDPFWGGLYHFPGSVLRADDNDTLYESSFKRIFEEELHGVLVIGEPKYFKTQFQKLKRGATLTAIHIIEVAGNSPVGTFFNVEYLPQNIIEYHRENIISAAKMFRQ